MEGLKISKKIYISLGVATALVLFFLLYYVFPGKIILPQLIRIGSVPIRYYGLTLVAAIVAAYFLAQKRLTQYGLSREKTDDLFLVLLISGFIGARLYHVATQWSYYAHNPFLILAVWYGGLSIFGALIGGVIGLWIYIRFFDPGMPLLKVLDWLAPSLSLGQAIGRFGNLFNYEAYGRPTNWPWKMFVPREFRLTPYELSTYFHPLFLYEAAGSLFIAWFLIQLSPKVRSGQLFLLWLFLYNGMRFFLEILRVDSTFIGGVKLNMVVSLLLALLGLIGFLNKQKHVLQSSHDH